MIDIIGPLLVLAIGICFMAATVWLARLISGKTRYTITAFDKPKDNQDGPR